MKNKIQFLTTTSSIEGYKIEKYLGIVTHQAVHGTDIFSDFMAGFSDVFGGYSTTYQKKLQLLEDTVVSTLKSKALKLGADAIIGVRLDFDEISGKGKGMLMLTAQGTAVKLNGLPFDDVKSEDNSITYIELDNAIVKKNMLENLRKGSVKIENLEDVEKLINVKIGAFEEVLEFIIQGQISVRENEDMFREFMSNVDSLQISEYLRQDKVIDLDRKTYKKVILMIALIDWFDFELLNYLLKHENPKAHQKALILLGFQKPVYTLQDIPLIEKLVTQMNKTFAEYPITTVKSGMFGKQKEVWKCINCGSENDITYSVCVEYECSSNCYGTGNNNMTPIELIKDWKLKIEMLKNLLG